MTLLGILTLVAIGAIVAAVAVYLILILVLLRKTLSTLGTVNEELATIRDRVEPLEPILTEVNADLTTAHDALRGVLDKKGAEV